MHAKLQIKIIDKLEHVRNIVHHYFNYEVYIKQFYLKSFEVIKIVQLYYFTNKHIIISI